MDMRKSNLYVPLWTACLPKIKEALKNKSKDRTIPLKKEILDSFGDRKSYTFRLELEKGVAANNIKGSAVARELYAVLSDDLGTKKLLTGKKVFRLDSSFNLHILNSTL